MRRVLIATLLCLLPTATLAQIEMRSGEAKGREWKKQPSRADILKVYPKEALDARKSGEVALRCYLTVRWYLRDCKAVGENPRGAGFAAAAVALEPLYQMRVGANALPPPAAATMVFRVRFVCDGCVPVSSD